MSLLVCSTIKITELDILRRTVARYGNLIWNEGAKTFKSYGQTGNTKSEYGTVEHSITVAGAHYQIGVIRSKDGDGWQLAFDTDDRQICAMVGRNSEKLITAYAEELIRDEAARNGYMLEESTDSEGAKILTAIVPD
jgi:hypothetical protein